MLEVIKRVMAEKGYQFFEGDRNINLIGIRYNDSLTNEFDDSLIVIIQINGKTRVKLFDNFTTDPGYFYIKEKFLNKDGCAIVKPGQYKGLYQIGKHRNYPALVQVGEVTVYRDADKDELITKGVEDVGIFGINMHHAYNSEDIDAYSAGCQVHQTKEQLDYILRLCEVSAEVYGNSFTYTLLESSDFFTQEEKKAADEKAKVIAELKKQYAKSKVIAEKKAADAKAKVIAEKKAADAKAKVIAEKKAADAKAKLLIKKAK